MIHHPHFLASFDLSSSGTSYSCSGDSWFCGRNLACIISPLPCSKFIKYCKACNVVLHRKIKTTKKDSCLLGLNINRKKNKEMLESKAGISVVSALNTTATPGGPLFMGLRVD